MTPPVDALEFLRREAGVERIAATMTSSPHGPVFSAWVPDASSAEDARFAEAWRLLHGREVSFGAMRWRLNYDARARQEWVEALAAEARGAVARDLGVPVESVWVRGVPEIGKTHFEVGFFPGRRPAAMPPGAADVAIKRWCAARFA